MGWAVERRRLATGAVTLFASALACTRAMDDAAGVVGGGGRAVRATVVVVSIAAEYKARAGSALEATHARGATRLRAMCEANGGLYVKAGQFVGASGGVPEAYVRELSRLQDDAAAAGRDATRELVREEFGTSPEELFETFDNVPMAAASLAQVHRAVLRGSGKEVAVKIQRPGLASQIESDIATMRALLRLTNFIFPEFDFGFMVSEFKSRLEKEIDFEAEGRNCERAKKAFEDTPTVDSPSVFWDFTTKRVLTMEFIRGEKVTNTEAMRAKGIDLEKAALALSDCFARMLLCHGFMHGDPHPGNLLVRLHPDGSGRTQVVLLDHGLYSELNEDTRRAMCELWESIAVGDAERASRASDALRIPSEFSWLMPLTLARKTPDGKPIDREALLKLFGDRRPGLGEASIIGNNLPKEMMIVLRANALVRNLVKALGDSREKEMTALEIKRQWSNVRYASLGIVLPKALGSSSAARASPLVKLRWRLRELRVFLRASRRAARALRAHRTSKIDVDSGNVVKS